MQGKSTAGDSLSNRDSLSHTPKAVQKQVILAKLFAIQTAKQTQDQDAEQDKEIRV